MNFWRILQLLFRKKSRHHAEVGFSGKRPERKKQGWIRFLILVVLGVTLIFLFPRGHSLQFSDLTIGSISPRRIIAPFSFEILKTREEYQKDREAAIQNPPECLRISIH
jgi:membrane-associated HD superfamily phosphohydrolase